MTTGISGGQPRDLDELEQQMLDQGDNLKLWVTTGRSAVDMVDQGTIGSNGW